MQDKFPDGLPPAADSYPDKNGWGSYDDTIVAIYKSQTFTLISLYSIDSCPFQHLSLPDPVTCLHVNVTWLLCHKDQTANPVPVPACVMTSILPPSYHRLSLHQDLLHHICMLMLCFSYTTPACCQMLRDASFHFLISTNSASGELQMTSLIFYHSLFEVQIMTFKFNEHDQLELCMTLQQSSSLAVP